MSSALRVQLWGASRAISVFTVGVSGAAVQQPQKAVWTRRQAVDGSGAMSSCGVQPVKPDSVRMKREWSPETGARGEFGFCNRHHKQILSPPACTNGLLSVGCKSLQSHISAFSPQQPGTTAPVPVSASCHKYLYNCIICSVWLFHTFAPPEGGGVWMLVCWTRATITTISAGGVFALLELPNSFAPRQWCC